MRRARGVAGVLGTAFLIVLAAGIRPAGEAPASAPGAVEATPPGGPGPPEGATFERLEAIRRAGARVPGAARARAEGRLATAGERIEEAARTQGEFRVVRRLARELRAPPESLIMEKVALGVPWGDLVIAHVLGANAARRAGARDLLVLHARGAGWGEIAAGLGLDLGDVVRAVRAEARVAVGLAHGDGRVAAIRRAPRGDGYRATAALPTRRANTAR